MSNFYSPEFAYRSTTRTGLSIVEYITKRAQHGRLGNPAIPAGTKLFLLAWETGGFYIYGYLDATQAILAMNNMISNGSNTKGYEDFNVVYNPDNVRHIGGTDKRNLNRKSERQNWKRYA